MPRIRSVKPEFWSDEKLSFLSDSQRLLFLGLLNMADDLGRLVDNPKQVEAFVWPQHNKLKTAVTGLHKLAELRVIQRGLTAAGQPIIQITNWKKHQRVDHPNYKASLPPIAGQNSRSSREALANDSRDDHELRSRATITSAVVQSRESFAKSGHAKEAPAAVLEKFANPTHGEAFSTFFGEAKRPTAFVRTVEDMATTFTWPVVGAALADMAGNGMSYNVKLLRKCAMDLASSTGRTAGSFADLVRAAR